MGFWCIDIVLNDDDDDDDGGDGDGDVDVDDVDDVDDVVDDDDDDDVGVDDDDDDSSVQLPTHPRIYLSYLSIYLYSIYSIPICLTYRSICLTYRLLLPERCGSGQRWSGGGSTVLTSRYAIRMRRLCVSSWQLWLWIDTNTSVYWVN